MLSTVKDGSGKSTYGFAGDSGSLSINVPAGTYALNFKGTGADGNFYDFNKTISVSAGNVDYAVDYSNLSKVTLANSYLVTPTFGSYTFTKADGSIETSFDDNDCPNGSAFIEKGSYSVSVSKLLRGADSAVTGTYPLDCSGNSETLTLGANLSASVSFANSSYNAGDAPVISAVSVKDGAVQLNGFNIGNFSASSIDVMHGSRVIKSFSGFIPKYLKGECELRANISNPLFANYKFSAQPVTINNSTSALDGDINLDGIVDIYDLVLMSEDIGKTKAGSADWDGRCNLDSSDNTISISDIAKAAQNYNKTANYN